MLIGLAEARDFLLTYDGTSRAVLIREAVLAVRVKVSCRPHVLEPNLGPLSPNLRQRIHMEKGCLKKGRHGDQAVRKCIPSHYLLSIIGAHHAPIIPSVAAIVSGTVGAYLLPSGAEVGDARFGVRMTLT